MLLWKSRLGASFWFVGVDGECGAGGDDGDVAGDNSPGDEGDAAVIKID